MMLGTEPLSQCQALEDTGHRCRVDFKSKGLYLINKESTARQGEDLLAEQMKKL